MELGEKQSMKKITALSIFFLILLPLCANSFRFSFVWEQTITATSSLEIMVYDTENDTPLLNDTKNLERVDSIQNVAKIKYISTAGGIHTFSYKATPLTSLDDTGVAYGYNLFFNYAEEGQVTQETVIEVGDDPSPSAIYPRGVIDATITMDFGRGGINTAHYIYVRAELDSLEGMKANANYSSTIIIERTTE